MKWRSFIVMSASAASAAPRPPPPLNAGSKAPDARSAAEGDSPMSLPRPPRVAVLLRRLSLLWPVWPAAAAAAPWRSFQVAAVAASREERARRICRSGGARKIRRRV